MTITTPYDLTPAGDIIAGKLTFDGETLAAGDFSCPAADIGELRLYADVGCARIEACAKNSADWGGNRTVCRLTMTCAADAGEFCKAVNHCLETGELLPLETGRARQCPKRGCSVSADHGVCLTCMPQGEMWARALRMLKPHWRLAALAALFMALVNGANLLVPYLNRVLLDRFLQPEPGAYAWLFPPGYSMLRGVILCGAAVTAAIVLGRVFTAMSSLLAAKVSAGFGHSLRTAVFGKVTRLSLSEAQRRSSGDLIIRVLADTGDSACLVGDFGFGLLETCVMFALVAAAMLRVSPLLTLLVLLPVPAAVALAGAFEVHMRHLWLLRWRCTEREASVLHDIIKGVRVVKTFGSEAREIEKYAAAARQNMKVRIQSGLYHALAFPWLRQFIGIGEVAALLAGGLLVLRGRLTPGALLQFTLLLGLVNAPLASIGHMPNQLMAGTVSLAKVFELLDEPPEQPLAAQPLAMDLQGRVDFEDVQFGYQSYDPVLRDVNLSIRPGEMVGLVGHSGAGKSTMINLVLRLYDPDTGALRMDGHDARAFDPHCLRGQMGAVFQETFLFRGTLYDNIAYARPGASPAQVMRAARAANAHGFIMRLPDGYDTVIGEEGHTLSGGERQRVAIARAVLREPKILILDEATSALDPETEEIIQQALARLVQGRTTIAIAHRRSTLRHADRLVVIDHGRVAEQGTHRELLQRRGIYYGLVMAQRFSGDGARGNDT